jgi:hypothetical protein
MTTVSIAVSPAANLFQRGHIPTTNVVINVVDLSSASQTIQDQSVVQAERAHFSTAVRKSVIDTQRITAPSDDSGASGAIERM